MVALGLALSSFKAQGQEQRLNFQTPFDRFELVLGRKGGTVAGQSADLSTLRDLLPMLTNPLANTCPSTTGRPELTVKIGSQTRQIFVSQGIIKSGEECLNVAGDGLHYLPVHRDFLIGPKADNIVLRSPVRVLRDGKKILEIKKQGDEWVNENPKQLLNWDFVERFIHSLGEFRVRLRVQSTIAADKPKITVQSGSQSYEFYRITNIMWAVKKPGSKWLIASDEWGIWGDFEEKQLTDRYAPEIEKLRDPETDAESRMTAMRNLEGSWSRNLRDIYHEILLNPEMDGDLRMQALKRLKRKPSLATAGVMVKVISEATDEYLREEAGIILRLQHPKGPRYNRSSSASERNKTVEFWRKWWQQRQRTKRN